MAKIQTEEEIRSILTRIEGAVISALQVLGINSLKSLSPRPEAIAGELIESTSLAGRLVTMVTPGHLVVLDLQRTGTLIWLPEADLYTPSAKGARPTVRLLLAGGSGLDITEPAKTKRVAVTLTNRPRGHDANSR